MVGAGLKPALSLCNANPTPYYYPSFQSFRSTRFHPDKNVDVAIVRIYDLLMAAHADPSLVTPYLVSSMNGVSTSGLDVYAGSDIVVVGYPKGFYDWTAGEPFVYSDDWAIVLLNLLFPERESSGKRRVELPFKPRPSSLGLSLEGRHTTGLRWPVEDASPGDLPGVVDSGTLSHFPSLSSRSGS